jgi:hypothetical protein
VHRSKEDRILLLVIMGTSKAFTLCTFKRNLRVREKNSSTFNQILLLAPKMLLREAVHSHPRHPFWFLKSYPTFLTEISSPSRSPYLYYTTGNFGVRLSPQNSKGDLRKAFQASSLLTLSRRKSSLTHHRNPSIPNHNINLSSYNVLPCLIHVNRSSPVASMALDGLTGIHLGV